MGRKALWFGWLWWSEERGQERHLVGKCWIRQLGLWNKHSTGNAEGGRNFYWPTAADTQTTPWVGLDYGVHFHSEAVRILCVGKQPSFEEPTNLRPWQKRSWESTCRGWVRQPSREGRHHQCRSQGRCHWPSLTGDDGSSWRALTGTGWWETT